MIIEFIFWAFVGVYSVIAGLLPSWDPIAYDGGPLDLPNFGPGYAFVNHFFPLDVVITLAAVMFSMWVILLGYFLVVWLLTKFHILGGSSTE